MDQLRSVEVTTTNGRRSVYSSAGEAPLTSETLRNIVLRHCVCYEVWPEWSANGGRATRIGFAISLCGVHENGFAKNDVPGCPQCWRTYTKLRMVADRITPEQERTCRFEIAAFDRAWHVAPNARQGRNETVVTIRIFHRHNIHAPIDDCQQECLNEMRKKLAELGVRENVWVGC
jgi:hypothetical protein